MKYFDKKNNRLVFIGQSATPSHWDNHWESQDFRNSVLKGARNNFVLKATKKFLPSGAKILEGGCGKGQFVYSLHQNGYKAIGLDYAQNTVKQIHEEFPELNVVAGDVMNIPFPDQYFDGYWSIGVIEHVYQGYEKIIEEAQRVIKKEGFLFLTCPQLSLLRRIKSRLGLYENFDPASADLSKFYQFALDYKKVQQDIEKHNFVLVKKKSIAGFKGLKDEVSFLKKLLQKIYDSQWLAFKIMKVTISFVCDPFSGHSILMVFRKK